MVCSDCDSEFHVVCLMMSRADVGCIKTGVIIWRCQKCYEIRRKNMRLESDAVEGKTR